MRTLEALLLLLVLTCGASLQVSAARDESAQRTRLMPAKADGELPTEADTRRKVKGEEKSWPFDSCINCPGPQWVRHTGYQAFAHWTLKPGPHNFLPRAYCPPRTQRALAKGAIEALVAAGYTKTARILEASEVLLDLKQPATLFAPNDDAYLAGNLPIFLFRMLQGKREGSALGKAIMYYHTVPEFKTYFQLQSADSLEHATLLGGSSIQSFGFNSWDLSFVKVGEDATRPQFKPALVVKKDLHCSALLVIHGINRVLVPPASVLPAGTPPAPTVEEQTLSLSEKNEPRTVALYTSSKRIMSS